MKELECLNSLEPLKSLEINLRIEDTKVYYSNVNLLCMSMNFIYKSTLILNSIEVKRNNKSLTIQEYKNLRYNAYVNTLKANLLLDIEKSSYLFWNNEDIKSYFVSKLNNKIIIT